jgi:beta-galactosidase
MNILPDDQFLFGASCAPYAKSMDWDEAEWDNDFATMRKLNFNVVRIFAAWNRIEHEEGIFDYTKQDYVLELASKHGLKVILNFGGVFANICGIYPPHYMLRNYDCHPRQSSPGAPEHNWGPTANICSDTPIYREKAFEFMTRTVRRYAESEEILAWMVWNEPASPVCYCPHTQTRFREWLCKKYQGDLNKLNRLWGTEYPIDYHEWSEIHPPTNRAVLNIWNDWMQFNQFRLYCDLNMINEVVKKNDPKQRPTTANLVHHMAALEGPVNAPKYGLDLGKVGQSMSIMGLSYYTTEHRYDVGTGYLSAYKLSRLRSTSADDKRRLLVLETGAGPNMAMATEDQHMVNFHQLLAHNVKSILLWNYRSRLSDSQVALFNLMKWDGSISRRARYMAKFSKLLQDNARLLNNVTPERQAAILTLEEQQVLTDGLCFGHDSPSEYHEEHYRREGAYKLLWDLHIPTDCLTECQLSEMNKYQLLLLPMQDHISAELAEKIRDYVAAGGTVIAESPFAFRSTDNILQPTAPAFGLAEVFGCQTHDRENRETAPKIICPDGEAEVCLFWSEYDLTGGTAIATYANGAVAAVANDFGKGRAILFGTEVFRQYIQNPQSAITALLQKEVLASGVEPVAVITGGCADNVEISYLTGEEGEIYFFINHNHEARNFTVELRHNGPWLELGSKQRIDMNREITLSGQDVLAVYIEI